MIALPSPTGKPDLQLETFYIDNDAPYASWITPYCKPAIYLYPRDKSLISVKLDPKLSLTYTKPQYPAYTGWSVFAYPDGTITHAGRMYDYLYYETEIPEGSYRLPKEGYVIEYDNLSEFIPGLVSKLGLNMRETSAFSEYWLSVLPRAPFYRITIISQQVLDEISPLQIVPGPDTLIRVTLHFTALDEEISLPTPNIEPVRRNGFTVVEWGGLFKKDPNRPFSCFM